MNLLIRHIFGIFILTLLGCSNNYYSPLLYKKGIGYQFKPMSSDSIKTANYITGSKISSSENSKLNASDNITVWQLAYNRATTYQHINLSYGAFGFTGVYKNGTLERNDHDYFESKSSSGIGFHFSGNFFVKDDNSDQRVLGIDAAYSTEFGDYSNFRKTIKNSPNIYLDGNNSILTVGATNETIWHNRKWQSFQYGYRFFFGEILGNHQFINNSQPGVNNTPYIAYKDECFTGTFFMQIKKYQGVIEVTNFSSGRFSLGYRF